MPVLMCHLTYIQESRQLSLLPHLLLHAPRLLLLLCCCIGWERVRRWAWCCLHSLVCNEARRAWELAHALTVCVGLCAKACVVSCCSRLTVDSCCPLGTLSTSTTTCAACRWATLAVRPPATLVSWTMSGLSLVSRTRPSHPTYPPASPQAGLVRRRVWVRVP